VRRHTITHRRSMPMQHHAVTHHRSAPVRHRSFQPAHRSVHHSAPHISRSRVSHVSHRARSH
jgi:hypothetical protein